MRIALISCYELGRQPFNIASPWAQLEAAGFDVVGADTALDPLEPAMLDGAELVAISVPMHTALRLGTELVRTIRQHAPHTHICFFGLYASLNAEHLLSEHADSVIGGEFEVALVGLANALRDGHSGEIEGVVSRTDQLVRTSERARLAPPVLRRLPFVLPQRTHLPPPSRYASFEGPTPKEHRRVGYLEASRGCKHSCLHCPITPVYQGRFFAVPRDIVLADAAQQVAAGAEHITFGDPDFLNGPTHALRIARTLRQAHPELSFDVTIKVEHILQHRTYMAELAELGCAFVVSAVESLSDTVLVELDKGHTRRDVFEALQICRDAGIALRPSLVAFTPWTTLDDYIDLVDWIVAEGLIDSIEPIQLAIRLLVPPGSALLWSDRPRPWLGACDDENFGYRWTHPDGRLDELHAVVSRIAEDGIDDDPAEVVTRIRHAAYRARGDEPPQLEAPPRQFVPRLSETWFCCAEPSAAQMARAKRS
jgi:radical SAM superfamily enzyme YgiQ (UPF0313 family)